MENTIINKYQKEGEKAVQQQKLYEEIYQSLRNNKKIQDYYKDYNQESVDVFLKDYAKEKINILEWGPSQIKILESQNMVFSNAAFECLKQIQQKKLFDLQCQWRADLITLEGVETTDDFGIIAEDILNCKLISPVSEAELDMFIDFLNNEDFHGLQSGMPDSMWQLYIAFKKDYEGDPFMFIGMPEWYTYHNLCTGNTKYLILPDIRGEKEYHYIGLADNKAIPLETMTAKDKKVSKKKSIANAEPIKEETVVKPKINYYALGYLSWFVHEFEDKKTAREFKNTGGELNYDEDDDKYDYSMVNEIVSDLSVDGKIRAVESNYNWVEGLKETLHKYQIQERKDAISPAYEQYCMYIENGISFEKMSDGYTLMAQQSRRAKILAGRKIAGEPEDLNF